MSKAETNVFPISYDAPVYRPPSEAKSLLLQVTIGCSHNKCTYCNMYRSKEYRVRQLAKILEDITCSADFYRNSAPEKIFLCDGDALAAPMDILEAVLDEIAICFPRNKRIGIYATAQNIIDKSNEELRLLSNKKIKIAYLGMESGCDKVLKKIVKGNTADDMRNAAKKLALHNIDLSLICMLGIGGTKHSASHCKETAKIISEIKPKYLSFLTTVTIPGTPFATMVDKGKLELLTTKSLLGEMRDILAGIKTDKEIIVRANHVSNLFPIAGTYPEDRDKLVQVLIDWYQDCPEGSYPNVSPEYL